LEIAFYKNKDFNNENIGIVSIPIIGGLVFIYDQVAENNRNFASNQKQ